MDSSLAPVLANIILTEFEKIVVTPLMKCGILKFYCRYVNDTLVLVKEDQTDKILKALKIMNNDISSDLYINYSSYELWHTKTA